MAEKEGKTTTTPTRAVTTTTMAAKKDEAPTPTPAAPVPDDDDVSIIYEKVTLTNGCMELHIARLAEKRWRLYAQLNFVTVSEVVWAYEENVEGSHEEVLEHARRRLSELASLKEQHDAVHVRVLEMSEGRS